MQRAPEALPEAVLKQFSAITAALSFSVAQLMERWSGHAATTLDFVQRA